MRVYCSDIEGDGLLDDITKVWCMSNAELDNKNQVIRDFTLTKPLEIAEMFANKENILVMHNGISYDGPAVTKVLGVEVKAEIVDTLYLSWYLYPKTVRHGLAAWGEELGIAKPTIDDWENLSLDEYIHRCEEDVRIQVALWKQIWKHLTLLYTNPEKCWHAIRHLNFKAKCAAMQEKVRWKLNVPETERLQELFIAKGEEAKDALEASMPQVPVMAKKSRPKKPYKTNGELSAIGLKWQAFCEEHGLDFEFTGEKEYIKGYKAPNAGSSAQVKDWLKSLGWVPEVFKYVRDKETGDVRKIPQIKDAQEGTLCPDIVRLIKTHPQLQHLEDMSVMKHRLGICNAFLNHVDDYGYVQALVQGLTNTLRFKHKVCLNLPSVRKPWGKEIRGLLMARSDDHELCGSDMSSLEDRTKQHYMFPYDPEYVAEMQKPDFDPHLDMAMSANMVDHKEVGFYKTFDKDKANDFETSEYHRISLVRHAGKGTNYAATYGAGGPAIARAAGVDESVGMRLHQAYWERNWSLKAIADACVVKQSRGMKWLWNPVAKLWLYLKADKDRFSTLNQSTGTYAFDRWVYHIFRKRPQLTAQFHDEVVLEMRKGNQEAMEGILKWAVAEVNKELKLNRDLDCDVDFGATYAEIH